MSKKWCVVNTYNYDHVRKKDSYDIAAGYRHCLYSGFFHALYQSVAIENKRMKNIRGKKHEGNISLEKFIMDSCR